MKRAGKIAGHDFGDNRVSGDGQRVRECLTERTELDNQVSLIRTHFTAIRCPPDSGLGRLGPPAALRGLPAIWDSGASHGGQRRAPNREGRSATMKWARINETWYQAAVQPPSIINAEPVTNSEASDAR